MTPDEARTMIAHAWRRSGVKFFSPDSERLVNELVDVIVNETDLERRAPTLYSELSGILNKHNRDNLSNTPDFILARYVINCLDALDETMKRRDEWYGRKENVESERADYTTDFVNAFHKAVDRREKGETE